MVQLVARLNRKDRKGNALMTEFLDDEELVEL